jgi:flagellin
LRINSAKDDAAGLAISDRFTAQIKGTDQAIRNANDGISMVQTAEGALSTLTTSLQRIRELAVQSANATNTATDRMALDEEVQELIADIRYTAFNTQFNGMAILDGSKGDSFFQVGANQGQMVAISDLDSRTIRLGNQEAFPNPLSTSGTSRLTSEQAEAMANDTNVTVDAIVITGSAGSLAGLVVNPIVTTGVSNSLEEAVRDINTAIQARIDLGDDDSQKIAESGLKAHLRTDNDGLTGIVITTNANPDIDTDANYQTSMFTVGGGTITNGGTLPDQAINPTTNPIFNGNSAIALTLDPIDNTVFSGLDVLTRETSSQAIGIIDGAMSRISSMRAEMGAVQNRFEARIENLGIGSVNMNASRSRIRDADFAAETAKLTKYQILQQSGISVLTQANALPQQTLSLLQQ